MGIALVAILSSGVTIGAFSLINRSANSKIEDQPLESGYAQPTRFTRVANHPAVETDFTVAAENTVNAVVSIKSTSTPKQSQMGGFTDPFFEYFFGQGGRNIEPQPRTGLGSGVIITPDKLDITLNDNRTSTAG